MKKQAECHPNKKYYAKNKCKECYTAKYNSEYFSNPIIKEKEKERNKKKNNTPQAKEARRIYASTSEGKEKTKKSNIFRVFNLTIEEYENIQKDLWNKQENLCACCGIQGHSYGKHHRDDAASLQLDHNHSTKEIRGLLCGKCNRALGLLNDDFNVILKLYNYRKKYT